MLWISDLIWNEVNEDHIAGHGVTSDEVEEVIFHHPYHGTRLVGDRYLVVGRTDAGRYLSIIVDREQFTCFYVVTARDAAPKERRLYQRHVSR